MENEHTYDEFLKAADAAGYLSGGFSEADLRLARANPDFGFFALEKKQQWDSAETPEARALIHAELEAKRRTLGAYSGGADGSEYLPTGLTGEAGAYGYGGTAGSFGTAAAYGTAPVFTDPHGAAMDAALERVQSFPDFRYDPADDPLYAVYRQAYTRAGQRAAADALAQAAALTGGIPSSYAASAAAQAAGNYAAQMADKLPELSKLAYQQYSDRFDRSMDSYNALRNARTQDLSVYETELERYNALRNAALKEAQLQAEQEAAARKLAQTDRSEAQKRIADFLAMGGDLSTLDAALRAQSGLTEAELQAMVPAAAEVPAGTGAGTVGAAPLSDEEFRALRNTVRYMVGEGGGAAAAKLVSGNYGRLSREQLRLISLDLGIEPAAIWSGVTPEMLAFFGQQQKN